MKSLRHNLLRNVCEKRFDYNFLKRDFGNGLHQIRYYKKSFVKGSSREPPEEKADYFVEPFQNERVNVSDFLDADGFLVAKDNRISRQKSMNRTISKIFDYAHSYEWEWFCTFTFSEELVADRKDFACVSKYMTIWLNHMRSRYCPDMKYILVPEMHKDGAFHFHGLFADCEGLDFVPAINNQEFLKSGKPNKYFGQPLIRKGRQIYNIAKFKGFTDCEKVVDSHKASSYVTKYITKELVAATPNKKRYWCSRGLPTPKEEYLFLPYKEGDFVESSQKILFDILEKYENVDAKTVRLEHGAFENEIVYITFSTEKR